MTLYMYCAFMGDTVVPLFKLYVDLVCSGYDVVDVCDSDCVIEHCGFGLLG